MTQDVGLQTITQIVFVAIFLVTVVDFAKRRDRARLEIALLFGTLALIIVIQGLSQLAGISGREVGLVGVLVILANPYLLLRLVEHFRHVPWYQHAIGLIYLAGSWGIEISSFAQGQTQPSPEVTLAIIVPFAYLEGYAALAFVRSAATSRGVTHRRLVAAALGSGFLGAVILLAGVAALAAPLSPIVKVASDLLGLASAVSYYLGFAPPAWLRRAWQMADLREFLAFLAGRSAEDRFAAAIDRLGPAAMRAVGGKGAVVFLGRPDSTTLHLHLDSQSRAILDVSPGLETLELGEQTPRLTAAWRERRPLVAEAPFHQLLAPFHGASKALVSPLVAHDGPHGLLLVLFDEHSVFLHDELELLNILSDQAALAMAGADLVEKLEEQNASLKEASRLKSEFLANMSHELRTPLNGIIGFSELMHDGKLGDVSEDQREYLGYILSSSRHLLQLINDVLDLSKVEAGKMDLFPEVASLSSLVAEVIDTLRPLAAEKDIVVETKLDESIDGVVLDKSKLKQVLYNFLSNSIKFTPEGGRVAVEIQPEESDSFRLAVQDTGIGINAEDVQRLFVEFQQLEGATDKRYPGTGLGLALTKRIVEAQGGSVGVHSVPGQGSTFYAILPRVTPGGVRPAPEPLHPAAARSEGASRVLVIEDNEHDRGWLIDVLNQAGYEVEAVASGEEAIARSRSQRFDAITLDLLLPDMHGWEVLRTIRAEAVNSDVPIIVVTVLADRSAAAGFAIQDFLPKPVKADDLLAALQRAGVSPETNRPVLVVDDDPIALKLMEATLTQLGYQTRCFTDSEQALRMAPEAHPAAVVLDLLMPGLDGFEFLDQFRRTAVGKTTPVLIWTNKDLLLEEHERLRASAQAVVSKASGGSTPVLEALQSLLAKPAAA